MEAKKVEQNGFTRHCGYLSTCGDDFNDVHITPVADWKKHEFSRLCWCKPVMEEPDKKYQRPLVIHNSFDGREFFEEVLEDGNKRTNH